MYEIALYHVGQTTSLYFDAVSGKSGTKKVFIEMIIETPRGRMVLFEGGNQRKKLRAMKHFMRMYR